MNARIGLPVFENTEQAVRFGAFMTRDQYLQLDGARQALQREFDRLVELHDQKHKGDRVLLQIMTDMAATLQKMREALECAPTLITASLIRQDSQDFQEERVSLESGKSCLASA